jgi:hypothetical protein
VVRVESGVGTFLYLPLCSETVDMKGCGGGGVVARFGKVSSSRVMGAARFDHDSWIELS